MRYDAFISYNHAADGGLAPALQDGLQRLAKPWYRRRAMEVFRDETNLSATPELFEAIEGALDESRYYVLLASTGSASSEWVGQEIRYWMATKTAASLRIVLVLTEGTLRWDTTRVCFDPDGSTALHPALHDAFASEPLHVDLRDARAATDGADADAARNFRRLFRHPIAKIAARIRGVDPDRLEGEDLRQHRRTLRTAWGAATVLVVLTVAAVFGLLEARRNSDRADHQAAVASAQLREARSAALAGNALSQYELLGLQDVEQRNVAILLAVLANRVAVTPASLNALMSILQPNGFTGPLQTDHGVAPTLTGLPGSMTDAVAVSSDARSAVIARSPGNALVLVDLLDGKVGRTIHTPDGSAHVAALTFARDGHQIAAQLADGAVLLWRTRAGRPELVTHAQGLAGGIAFAPDGHHLAIVVRDVAQNDIGNLTTVDIDRAHRREGTASLHDLPDGATDVQFTASGERVMVRSVRSVRFFDRRSGRADGAPVRPGVEGARIDAGAIVLPEPGDPVVATYRTADAVNVWLATRAGTIRNIPMLDAITGIERDIPNGPTGEAARAIVFESTLRFVATPDGKHLAVMIHSPRVGTYVFLFDPASTQPIGKIIQVDTASFAEGFTPGGSALVGVGIAPGLDGDVPTLWNLDLDVRHLIALGCVRASGLQLPARLTRLGALADSTPQPCPTPRLTVTPHTGLHADQRVRLQGRDNVAPTSPSVSVTLCATDLPATCGGTSSIYRPAHSDGTFTFTVKVPRGFVDQAGTAHDCTTSRCEYCILGTGGMVVDSTNFPVKTARAPIGFAPGTPAYVAPPSTAPPLVAASSIER